MLTNRFVWIVALLLLTAFAGCSGGSDSGIVDGDTDQTADGDMESETETVTDGDTEGDTEEMPASFLLSTDENGGEYDLGYGITLNIPEGAVDSDLEISIEVDDEAEIGDLIAVGPVFNFGPDKTEFSKPITLSLPYESDKTNLVVYWSDSESENNFTILNADIADGIATFEVSHFSKGFVGLGSGFERKACTVQEIPVDEPDLEQKKFALSMFHFNVQYVAGGLEAEVDGEMQGLCDSSCLGWTDERLIDWIITDTFEPVLDFYLAHPNWRATFEMQAMMMEAIGERHPTILKKLQESTKTGQIEIVSFHYSAQLFLAFPRRDLERSVDMTRAIFEKYDVLLSPVVFNQEGQAGEGKHSFMADNCYTKSVYPKNLYKYVRNGETRWPWYSDHGVDVVVGPGGSEIDPESGIEVAWTFFDDGELLAFPLDPYFAPFAKEETTIEELAKYEEELSALEEQGYKITSISDYMSQLEAQQIEKKELPPVVDGTWQPTSTSSILRWMGGRSAAPYNNQERDNYIRTTNYQIAIDLAVAEELVKTANLKGLDTGDSVNQVMEGWRQLLLAEVTDATGITPWIGEFMYAENYNAGAKEITDSVTDNMLTLLGWQHAMVDLETYTTEEIDDIPVAEAPTEVDAPFDLTIYAPTRTTEIKWYRYGDDNTYNVKVSIGSAADETGKDQDNCIVTLDFPRYEDKITYSPGLIDDTVVSYDFDDFSFQKEEIYLPLPNGLIGLGNDWWVIKQCRSVHLAARVPSSLSDEKTVQFIDETADPLGNVEWNFIVFTGSQEDALKLARRINTNPLEYR